MYVSVICDSLGSLQEYMYKNWKMFKILSDNIHVIMLCEQIKI